MKKLIALVLLCTGLFALDVKTEFIAGMAMNGDISQDSSKNTKYVKSESPLGVFGFMVKSEFVSAGYRHISSIPQMDETQGINEFIVRANYKGAYVGIAYNDDDLTSTYYKKQISTYSRIIGYEKDYSNDKYLFIEYRDSSIRDFPMFGVGFRFGN